MATHANFNDPQKQNLNKKNLEPSNQGSFSAETIINAIVPLSATASMIAAAASKKVQLNKKRGEKRLREEPGEKGKCALERRHCAWHRQPLPLCERIKSSVMLSHEVHEALFKSKTSS